MAAKAGVTDPYPVSPDGVVEMLLNRDYVMAKYEALQDRQFEVLQLERTDDGHVFKVDREVDANLPDIAKKVLGDTNRLVQSEVWRKSGDGYVADVKIDSPGPAIYRQRRVGRNGAEFTLYKFRTMSTDAERDGPRFTSQDDPRITRTGRFLRKSRLDEVPQLWNVLRGELAIVGPRPERPVFVDQFSRTIPFYASRQLIRPGVTGWAQVHYGYADGEADTVEKLTYDLYYVKHSSLWMDVHVLGMSIWTVLTGTGAR